MKSAVPPVVSAAHLADCAAQLSVAEFLTEQARQRPDQEAVIFEGQRLTYGDLDGRARAVADQLRQLGIGRGEKVGIFFPNHTEYVAAFFAVVGLGAVVVPINPLLKFEEIAHILSDSDARALIAHERLLPEVRKCLPLVTGLAHLLVFGSSSALEADLPSSEQIDVVRLTAARKPSGAVAWPQAVEPQADLAVLVYTSGTTGKPKGAMLSHANLLFGVRTALNAFEVAERDRILAVLPLCHIYGLSVVMLGIISRGGSLVIVEKFEAGTVLKAIEKEKISLIPAVPAMYQFLLMELEQNHYDISSVRCCWSGAAALPVEVLRGVESRFAAPVVEGYGLTEVSCVATANRLSGARKPGSVGPAFQGVQVSIFNSDGQVLAAGQENIGEIAIKGPNVMRGYHGQPRATAETLVDGWFLTGDLGYLDADGFLHIVGRKKELIIRGGQNIYPREIEEVIMRLDGVAEVAVIGVPDQYMGERVKAVVVNRAGGTLTTDQVKSHCAEHLAEYKVPRLVDFVEALPRNSTGKVLKRMLS